MAFRGLRENKRASRGSFPHRSFVNERDKGSEQDIMDGALGDLLATLSVGDFQKEDESQDFKPKITDCEHITSYTLLNKGSAILVPGRCPCCEKRAFC